MSTQNEDDNKQRVEKIFVKAVRDVELSDYLIYDTTFDDEDEFSNKGRHVYRFPTCELTKGKWAVIRIEEGERGPEPIHIDDKPGLLFHWGRKAPIINNTGDTLTLVEIKGTSVFSTK